VDLLHLDHDKSSGRTLCMWSFTIEFHNRWRISWHAKQLSAVQERFTLTENQRNYTNLNKDRLMYRILAYLGKHALILDHIFVSCEKNVEFCGTHLTLYLPSHARWAFVCNHNHRRCPLIELQNPIGKCAAKTPLLVNQKCIPSRTAPLAVFSWNNF
jgi:hypothetical protein